MKLTAAWCGGFFDIVVFHKSRTWANDDIFLFHLGIKFPTKDLAMNIWKLYSGECIGDLSGQDQGNANEDGMNLFMLQCKKLLLWLPNIGRIPTRTFLFEIRCKLQQKLSDYVRSGNCWPFFMRRQPVKDMWGSLRMVAATFPSTILIY